MARIIGHLLGDGCIDKSFTPRYKNTQRELITLFENYMKEVFGLFAKNSENVSNSQNSIHDAFEIKFSSACGKILHKIFEKFSYGEEEKHVPSKIFEWPIELQLELISAIIDDDGSIFKRRITIDQVEERLTNELVKLLECMGLKPTVNERKNKKYTNDHIHRITIYGYKDLYFLSTSLRLRHPNKARKLMLLRQRYENIRPKRRKGELEREIISFLKSKRCGSSTEIAKQLKCHKENIRIKLVDLCEVGIIKRSGRGNKIRYHLASVVL